MRQICYQEVEMPYGFHGANVIDLFNSAGWQTSATYFSGISRNCAWSYDQVSYLSGGERVGTVSEALQHSFMLLDLNAAHNLEP